MAAICSLLHSDRLWSRWFSTSPTKDDWLACLGPSHRCVWLTGINWLGQDFRYGLVIMWPWYIQASPLCGVCLQWKWDVGSLLIAKPVCNYAFADPPWLCNLSLYMMPVAGSLHRRPWSLSETMTGRNVSEICEIDDKVVRLLVLRLLVCQGRNHECAAIESFQSLMNSIDRESLGEYGWY